MLEKMAIPTIGPSIIHITKFLLSRDLRLPSRKHIPSFLPFFGNFLKKFKKFKKIKKVKNHCCLPAGCG